MAIGPLGLPGRVVRLRVALQRCFVCDLHLSENRWQLFLVCSLLGTRNCTGAANGGVCLGSALDTQLCDTNVSCTRMFSRTSRMFII